MPNLLDGVFHNTVLTVLHGPVPMEQTLGVFLKASSRMPRWGWVAKSEWPILLLVHPLEKSATSFKNISIHRLFT
jgi:hypothetical protein